MSGDFSRESFDSLRDYASVLWQQGRPNTDAEWNEMGAVLERRVRTGTVDTIGRSAVPRETPDGFRIRIADDGGMEIGRGRAYLDGMLFECHGDADFAGSGDGEAPVFDRGDRVDEDGNEAPALGVLDEVVAPRTGQFLAYGDQPYWPNPAEIEPDGGPHLAYLVGWKRHVNAIQEPRLLEPALDGIDTTTRLQHVWQVRLHGGIAEDATCATPDADVGGDEIDWADLIAPSTARLTTDTVEIDDPENPCLVPPTDGYTGLENQLYRVELHVVGDAQQDARFKFSRENASVQAAVESFSSPADGVVVQRIGRDELLRFAPGDWVELTDDVREFDHRAGQMLRVAVVDEETRTVEFDATADPDLVPSGAEGDTALDRHTRLIRWDQRGVVRDVDGAEVANLDAADSDGLIGVPADATALVLESGVTVSFSTAEGRGGFRELDFWRFAARTAGTQVERLRAAPPDGIQRHHSRLAVIDFPDSVQDCRTLWPPEFGESGGSCACTVCVTPESHNSGALTIQGAVDQLTDVGGTVCLDGGVYRLDSPIVIRGRRSVTLQGQGTGTVLAFAGQDDSAIRVEGSIDVQISELSLVASGVTRDRAIAGISAVNSAGMTVHRVAILLVALGDGGGIGMSLDGLALGHRIDESLIIAPIGIGSRSAARSFDDDAEVRFLAVGELRVADNMLFGSRSAVQIEGTAINIASARFSGNLVVGGETGMDVGWVESPSASTTVETGTIMSDGDGLRLGVGHARVLDNEVSGGAEVGDGIRLRANLLPALEGDSQIVGNRIVDLAGTGIRTERAHAALLIKRNIIRRCGGAAIATGPDATTRHLAIENNVVESIGDAANREAGAGAIVLTQVESGQIMGNRIEGVGTIAQAPGTFAGIAVEGSRDVSIESNMISAIGPPGLTSAIAIGIHVGPPYTGVVVRANRILGATGPDDPSPPFWIAVLIGGAGGRDVDGTLLERLAGAGSQLVGAARLVSDQLDFVALDDARFALAATRIHDLGPVDERQVSVASNHVRSAGNTALPMVAVIDRVGATVSFNDNQCQLDTQGSTATLVALFAERVIAANNAVRRRSDQDAMTIDVGQRGRATVLGNLTFGNIRLQPGGLNPPFADLNLLAG